EPGYRGSTSAEMNHPFPPRLLCQLDEADAQNRPLVGRPVPHRLGARSLRIPEPGPGGIPAFESFGERDHPFAHVDLAFQQERRGGGHPAFQRADEVQVTEEWSLVEEVRLFPETCLERNTTPVLTGPGNARSVGSEETDR